MKKLLFLIVFGMFTLIMFAPSSKNHISSNYKDVENFPTSFEEAENFMDTTFTNIDENIKKEKTYSTYLAYKKDSI
jgi:hypothetical protein